MEDWLKRIAREEYPADWNINEEGWKKLLRVRPELGGGLDFQVWSYPYSDDPGYPPEMNLRARIDRFQFLSEYHRRFTRYVEEDFDPGHWNMLPEDVEGQYRRSDLRQIDLSFLEG